MVLASSERIARKRRSVAWAITLFFGTSTFLGCPSRAQYIAPGRARATAAADLHARYARLVSDSEVRIRTRGNWGPNFGFAARGKYTLGFTAPKLLACRQGRCRGPAEAFP